MPKPPASGRVRPTSAPVEAPNRSVPSSGRQAPTPTAKPVSSFLPNNSIKEMQEAILEFANVASSTDLTNIKSNVGKQEGEQVNTIRKENPNFDSSKPISDQNPKYLMDSKHEYLGGTDPFGNFLVQNYLGKSDPIGNQYLNIDVLGGQNRDNTSIKDINIRGVIDTIKRIGTPGAEKKVDGIWQTRTNNALKNIYALGYAMVNLAKDMGLDISGFDAKQLESFKTLIPLRYTDVSSEDKYKLASQITPYIKKLTEVFSALKKFVFENKDYKDYIDQTKSFIQHKTQDAANVLSDAEKKVLKETSSPVPINYNNLSLQDLSNMSNFKSFVDKIGKNSKNPEDIKNTIQEISDILSGESKVQTEPGY